MAQKENMIRDIESVIRALYATINIDEYIDYNPDILISKMHPIHHFIRFGWKEDRKISKNSQVVNFLSDNFDILNKIKQIDNLEYHKYIDQMFDSDNIYISRNDVRFVGYLESSLGLGIALRNTIQCYRLRCENFSIYPYNNGAKDRFDSKYLPEKYDTHKWHKINIFEVGLDNIEHALMHVTKNSTQKSYNVIKLYWELSEIPREKVEALNLYDEVWVPSQFIYDAVAKVFNKKILVIPPYIDIKVNHKSKRRNFSLKDETFYFLFSFDYNSSIYRKNPIAVINAFQEAFPSNDRSVGLIIKSNSPTKANVDLSLVNSLKNCDDRIKFIEGYLDRDEMLSLISCCDCYVSLHRSEGYGMGIAEAICLGLKVIATNYSGNVDFMSNTNSFPVDYKIINVETGNYYLSDGKEWADPIHDSAVNQFRAAYNTKFSLLRKTLGGRLFYRTEIPSKARISRMISARICNIKKELR